MLYYFFRFVHLFILVYSPNHNYSEMCDLQNLHNCFLKPRMAKRANVHAVQTDRVTPKPLLVPVSVDGVTGNAEPFRVL